MPWNSILKKYCSLQQGATPLALSMCEAYVQFLGPRMGGEIPYVANRKS